MQQLNDLTLKAFGFKKHTGKYPINKFYTLYNKYLVKWKPGKSCYYCANCDYSPEFNYVHELQDFLAKTSYYVESDAFVLFMFKWLYRKWKDKSKDF